MLVQCPHHIPLPMLKMIEVRHHLSNQEFMRRYSFSHFLTVFLVGSFTGLTLPDDPQHSNRRGSWGSTSCKGFPPALSMSSASDRSTRYSALRALGPSGDSDITFTSGRSLGVEVKRAYRTVATVISTRLIQPSTETTVCIVILVFCGLRGELLGMRLKLFIGFSALTN